MRGPPISIRIAWQADLRRIERYYQARGFYQAQVVRHAEEPVGGNAVKLVAEVHEGEPTRIATVNITGMEALPQEHQRRVKEELPLKQGDIFEEANWEGVKDLLRSRLLRVGLRGGRGPAARCRWTWTRTRPR